MSASDADPAFKSDAPSGFALPDFALIAVFAPDGFETREFAARCLPPDAYLARDAEAAIDLRLKRRELTVIRAEKPSRAEASAVIAMARRRHAPAAMIGIERGAPGAASIAKALDGLEKEPFSAAIRLETGATAPLIRLEPLDVDARGNAGPFDVIGDVHGCYDELAALLSDLGWRVEPYAPGEALMRAEPPVDPASGAPRQAVFVGDLCDRGPRNVDALRLVMGMVEAGVAMAVVGNHDHKLLRWLGGAKVTLTHGLDGTVAELEAASAGFRERVRAFLAARPSHLWLDGGALVVAHAGLKQPMHGRASPKLSKFAMFGDVSGERDEYGLPIRRDWAREYRGDAAIAYGHTPTLRTRWRYNTICVDSGCCFGGRLTAMRWPERELVSVEAARLYSDPIKPLEGRDD